MQERPIILVTGASGFIGTRLVKALSGGSTPAQVRALDIVPPRTRVTGVEYYACDVRGPIPVEAGEGAATVYNLAAVHRTPGHPVHEYYETNILGASRVTSLAEACQIPRIVFTSSISVYGASEETITECSPLHPTSAYGHSKKLAEIIHLDWARRLPGRQLVIARPGVIFGPGEKGNFTNLARALKKGYFAYPGRKDTIKSGGYVDELLRAITFAVEQNKGEVIFNFAYPTLATTEEIVAAFSRVAGFRAKYPTIPAQALLACAKLIQAGASLGVRTPIHPERVMKLMKSTKIAPAWLLQNGYIFSTDLDSALQQWCAETKGAFE